MRVVDAQGTSEIGLFEAGGLVGIGRPSCPARLRRLTLVLQWPIVTMGYKKKMPSRATAFGKCSKAPTAEAMTSIGSDGRYAAGRCPKMRALPRGGKEGVLTNGQG